MLVCDVAPRDGLQNDPVTLDPADRAELCLRLVGAGVPRIEVASFVNPRKVPQMAGAEAVVERVSEALGGEALGGEAPGGEAPGGEARPSLTGLILNERGLDRADSCGLRHVQYALPVTQSFCERNQGVTLEQALSIGERVLARAREEHIRVGVALAVAFGCPFEGPVASDHVIEIAERVAAWEPYELSFADTIGVGVPTQVRDLVSRGAALGVPIGAHFHNTRNTGYANAVAALEAGVDVLDASVGGVGGCPFAPRATGNIATEDLVYLLDGMGVDTGIDLNRLIDCSEWLAAQLGHDTPGQLRKAGRFALV